MTHSTTFSKSPLTFDDLQVVTDADTNLKFTDISTEQWRVYRFSNDQIHIDNPVALNVSRSGGHRVLDAAGVSHYIPRGWNHLSWLPKDGEPNFVT